MKKLQIGRDVWLSVACVFVALMTVAVTAAEGGTRSARVMAARVNGNVEYLTETKQPWRPVNVGMILPEGLRLRTGAGASLDLALATGAIVRLNENTEIHLDRLVFTDQKLPAIGQPIVSDTQLTIERGQILSQVGKQSPPSSFEVRTPAGVVGVHGAEFMIWRLNNRTCARSFRDTIVFQIGGTNYTIRAGEQICAEVDPQNGVISSIEGPVPAKADDEQTTLYAAFKAETALLAEKVIDKGVVDLGQLLQTFLAGGQPLPQPGVIVVGNPATTSEVSPSQP